MSNKELTINDLLDSLEELIKEINVDVVEGDPNLDPLAVFDKKILGNSRNGTKIVKTKKFLETLQKVSFPSDVIQYSRISEKVFTKKQLFDGIENISEEILRIVEDNFKNMLEQDKQLAYKFYKIIDHIRLAAFQIGEISQHSRQEFERLQKEISHSRRELENLKNKLTSELTNVYTQFVTILGIFAAILMAAFGSVQGFSSLFENAHKLDIADILIISPIGASAIMLILFFLLDAIAKLTNKKLASVSDKKASILQRHPTLVIPQLLFVLVALIGTALKLSNVNIQPAWQALFWLLPFGWFIYLCLVFYKKRIYPFESDKGN